MSLECTQGIQTGCPYMETCESDSGAFMSADSTNYMALKTFNRKLLPQHKTWSDKKGLYGCLPKEKLLRRSRK